MILVLLKAAVLLWTLCLVLWSALLLRAFAVFPPQSREQLKVAAWCAVALVVATVAAYLADGLHIGKYSIVMAFVGLTSGAMSYKDVAAATRGIMLYKSA